MVSRSEQTEIRRKVKRILARRKMFQWGQPDSSLTGYGMYGCADTCIQLIARIAQGKTYTLNQVRRATGAAPYGPTSADAAARGLRRLGLPYVIKANISTEDLIHIVKTRGPVLVAYRYWAHPHWKGATYTGHRMNGWTTNNTGNRVFVGFSSPEGASGANQWGFRGGHAALIAWVRDPDTGETVIGIRDPNHGSTARPKKPAWDKVSTKQLRAMLNSIRPAYGGSTLVFIPTKRVVFDD
jgi:hypothetical protein